MGARRTHCDQEFGNPFDGGPGRALIDILADLIYKVFSESVSKDRSGQ
jgi:hypothetical protein